MNFLENCVSIDIETTGLTPGVHSMIDIGVCNFKNDDELLVKCSHTAVTKYDPKALEINGYSQRDLMERGAYGDETVHEGLAVRQVLLYCDTNDTHILIGKNPRLDYMFLLYSFVNHLGLPEREFPISYRLINWGDMVLPLMYLDGMQIPKKGFSSDDICEYLGIVPEPKPHEALTGAIYNKMCVLKILKRFNELQNHGNV